MCEEVRRLWRGGAAAALSQEGGRGGLYLIICVERQRLVLLLLGLAGIPVVESHKDTGTVKTAHPYSEFKLLATPFSDWCHTTTELQGFSQRLSEAHRRRRRPRDQHKGSSPHSERDDEMLQTSGLMPQRGRLDRASG